MRQTRERVIGSNRVKLEGRRASSTPLDDRGGYLRIRQHHTLQAPDDASLTLYPALWCRTSDGEGIAY